MQQRSLFIVLAICLLVPTVAAQESFDIIIRGGRVVDGSGNPWVRADIGIVGDRITRIGDLSSAAAKREILADGLVVAPGFIDPHTHARRGIFQVPTADNALLQGVTTLTEGNDGSSPLPVGEHLQRVAEIGISPNWAVFVGHGTVRNAVIGRDHRDPTAAELDQMKALVDTAMEEGALGLSTGLFYVPGAFSVPCGDGRNPSPSGEEKSVVVWSRAPVSPWSAHENGPQRSPGVDPEISEARVDWRGGGSCARFDPPDSAGARVGSPVRKSGTRPRPRVCFVSPESGHQHDCPVAEGDQLAGAPSGVSALAQSVLG